ncbi:MAG TPA: potassium-transporting ATPase subunit KdpC [Acidiferrobacter sp.]|nr:potassium-transporting ATPase subunit KdpC [Acidiferrobacter sp.]
MPQYLGSAIRLTALTWVLFGIGYPLLEVGINQTLFPGAANGSLVRVDGRVAGSRLIEQPFTGPLWFHGRPSAVHDNPRTSGASNLGPASHQLFGELVARRALLDQAHPSLTGKQLPADMITSSASGLDPDITPASAYIQASWVARARGIPLDVVRRLVITHITQPWLGLFGNARVNVLMLNLALQNMAASAQYATMKR